MADLGSGVGAPLVLGDDARTDVRVDDVPPDEEEPDATPDADTGAGIARDELQRINGVGPVLEQVLHDHGIFTYRQLALLDDAALTGIEEKSPRLVRRLRRGGWIAQARRLHVEAHGDQPEALSS